MCSALARAHTLALQKGWYAATMSNLWKTTRGQPRHTRNTHHTHHEHTKRSRAEHHTTPEEHGPFHAHAGARLASPLSPLRWPCGASGGDEALVVE